MKGKKSMKISYDKKVDAMYIQLKKGSYDRTKKVSEDILIDVGKNGDVLGLEILDAGKILGRVPSKGLTVQIAPPPTRHQATA